MEVPYEREGEEVVGMDLETKSRRKVVISPTSSITSESSGDDITNLEFFTSMNTVSYYNGSESVIFTNGQNKHIVGVGDDVVAQEVSVGESGDKVAVGGFDGSVVAENGTSEVSYHQNGSTAAQSVGDSEDGIKEMDAGSNGSSFSKSPNTGFGLKDVESLVNGHSENVVVNNSKGLGPDEDEFDVETVIRKQETHDLICPHCRSCITKRVILKRRKRTFDEFRTFQEPSGSGPGQDDSASSDNVVEERQLPPKTVEPSGSRFDAISCLSCFRVFIPTSEGFLCWRFKPKPGVAQQPDGTPTDQEQLENSQPVKSGNFFPLWMVTCCQPAEKIPAVTAPTNESEFQPTPATGASSYQDEPPLPTSHDSTFVPTTPADPPQKGGSPQGGQKSQNTLLNLIKPSGDTSPSETPPPLIDTGAEVNDFSMWFLTCCQPSDRKTDGSAPVYGSESLAGPSGGSDTPSAPVYGSESLAIPSGGSEPPEPGSLATPVYGSKSQGAQSDDNPVPPSKPTLPSMYDPDSGTLKPERPVTSTEPNDDLRLPTPSAAPGIAVLPKPPQSQLSIGPSGTHEPQTLEDVERGLVPEIPRGRVPGVDIIKAIVYGGLLESITSLSVITSAAGGDATTLNIVALGLANVFGGLIVLVHNLRLLNHEHTSTDHYEAQLGRPGLYLIHSIVAILSYLVFGLMSPLIYGFSFRESNNKDNKIATLAAAGLLSIAILSAAKAYVRTSPKGYMKTIFYYISLGLSVSGLGYVAGHLINELLKKLGIFDSHAPPNVSLPFTGQVTGAWSSY